MIEVCLEQAAGRVPVIAGCGSNDHDDPPARHEHQPDGTGADEPVGHADDHRYEYGGSERTHHLNGTGAKRADNGGPGRADHCRSGNDAG